MDDEICSNEDSIINTINLYLYLSIKRVFDIVASIIGILVLIPVVVVVKIVNILSGDYEPVFYSQLRIGKNGKEFRLYKLRSMVPNADKILDEILANDKKLAKEYKINKKLANDPRITKIGKILRKTSLDELPQVLNTFLGDMTFIGNRPYLLKEKVDMESYYEDIVKTKPGITGYWQVSGRSNVTFEERLKLESYYSNNATLLLDVKIFFQTFLVVLIGKTAR